MCGLWVGQDSGVSLQAPAGAEHHGADAGAFSRLRSLIMRERADALQEPGDVNFYVSLPELG
jgi:hypothetical protein